MNLEVFMLLDLVLVLLLGNNYSSSNTRILNNSKRLAFLWRWLCGWELCFRKLMR